MLLVLSPVQDELSWVALSSATVSAKAYFLYMFFISPGYVGSAVRTVGWQRTWFDGKECVRGWKAHSSAVRALLSLAEPFWDLRAFLSPPFELRVPAVRAWEAGETLLPMRAEMGLRGGGPAQQPWCQAAAALL